MNYLVEFLLGGIVLGVILMLVFPGFFRNAGELWSKTKDTMGWDAKAEFAPYVPQYTPSEQTIDDSMNALMCAIQATAKNGFDGAGCELLGGTNKLNNGNNAAGKSVAVTKDEEGSEVLCNGFLFGNDKCVTCTPKKYANNKVVCSVKAFELPQKITPGEDWIPTYGDPRYLVYYEQFPEHEKAAWQARSYFWFNVMLGVQGTLALVPVVGGMLSKAAKSGKTVKEVIDASEEVTDMTRRYNQALGIEDAAEDVQKIVKGTAAGASADVVQAAASASSKVKSVILSPSKVNEIRDVSHGAMDAYMKQNLPRTKIAFRKGQDAIEILDETGANNVENFIVSQSKNLDIEESILRDRIKQLLKKQPGQRTNKFIKKGEITEVLKDAKIQSISIAKETLESSASREAFREATRSLVLAGSDGTKKISALFSKLSSYYSKVKANPLKELDLISRRMKELSSGDDLTGLKKIAESADPKLIKEGEEVIETLAKNGEAVEATLWGLIKRDMKTFKPSAREAGVWAKETLKLRPVQFGQCIALGSYLVAGLALDSLVHGITPEFISENIPSYLTIPGGAFAVSGLINIHTLGIAGKIGFTFTPAMLGCIKFLQFAYIPTILASSYLFALEDSQNQAFTPIGINKVGVVEPKFFETTPRIYDPPGIENVYLSMTKGEGQAPERFFMASPCKADLEVTQSFCSCDLSNGDYVFRFKDVNGNEVTQPVKPAGYPKITIDYEYDKLNNIDKSSTPLTLQFFGYTTKIFNRAGFEAERTKFLEFFFKDKETFFLLVSSAMMEIIDTAGSQFNYLYMGRRNAQHTIEILRKVLNLSSDEYSSFLGAFYDVFEKLDFENPWKLYDSADFSEKKFGKLDLSQLDRNERIALVKTATWLFSFIKQPSIHRMIEVTSLIKMNDAYFIISNGEEGTSINWEKVKGDFHEIALVLRQAGGDGALPSDDIFYNKLKKAGTDMLKLEAFRLLKSKFVDDIGRRIWPKIYVVDPNSAFFRETSVKVCKNTATTSQAPAPNDRVTIFSMKKTAAIPCFSAKPNMDIYDEEGWNGGQNYCFTARNLGLELAAKAINGVSIAAGLSTAFLSAGTLTWVSILIVEATSIGTSIVLEKCGSWPAHKPTIGDCFT
ncbi:hypothetical protein HYU13_04455 [Candidatus Woesearchaeota archaeon]|nr:hypothetical protein [Candidatus Woesearchaeota archaeon]